MQDRELYQQILGLDSPRSVSGVELDAGAGEIRVRVEHPRGAKFGCPECESELACHDHASERRWRHLDSCQYKTVLIASVPRVKCPEHGVKNAPVPWAEKSNRFTLLFERFAIDVLLATQTVKGAQGVLRTSWDETWLVLQKAVARGQARKANRALPRIGIDEKAFCKGQSYVTLLYDLDNSTVEAISDGNDTQSGLECFSQLSEGQRDSVEAVAMDMSAAYVNAAGEAIPEAQVVHDRFHVMQMATTAVDEVRRGEHRQLKKEDDNRLAKTKYVWLKSQENLTEKQRAKLDEVFTLQLQTGKAWAYKELLRDLWNHGTPHEATDYFRDWYRRVIHTKLEPTKRVCDSPVLSDSGGVRIYAARAGAFSASYRSRHSSERSRRPSEGLARRSVSRVRVSGTKQSRAAASRG